MIVKLTTGEKLKDLIVESGKKQSEIAKALNISSGKLSSLCNGDICKGDINPEVLDIVRLAKYFNVSTDYLLTDTEIKSSNADLRGACELTGLDEDTITCLSKCNPIKRDFIEWLILDFYHDEFNFYFDLSLFDLSEIPDNEIEHCVLLAEQIKKLSIKLEEINNELKKYPSKSEDKNKIKKRIEILRERHIVSDELTKSEFTISGLKFELQQRFNAIVKAFIESYTEDITAE